METFKHITVIVVVIVIIVVFFLREQATKYAVEMSEIVHTSGIFTSVLRIYVHNRVWSKEVKHSYTDVYKRQGVECDENFNGLTSTVKQTCHFANLNNQDFATCNGLTTVNTNSVLQIHF